MWDLLRSLQLCSSRHFRQPWCMPLLRYHDHSWWPTQMPLKIYITSALLGCVGVIEKNGSEVALKIKLCTEEGKLCKSWNKAQQAQWTCWRVQHVHIHMPNEGRAHPFAWAPSRDEGPDLPITFQETCSTSKRGLFSRSGWLPQQVWGGLLYKERRQDLTTIKRPQHPQKRYVRN